MKKQVLVNEIMTEHVHSINIDEGIKSALNIVKKHHIRHLPVTNGDAIVGIISSSDLNRLTFSNLFEDQSGSDEAILEMLSISQVMSDKPKVVHPDLTIEEAARILVNESYHSLPVVHDNKLVGIVTTTDLLRHYLDRN